MSSPINQLLRYVNSVLESGRHAHIHTDSLPDELYELGGAIKKLVKRYDATVALAAELHDKCEDEMAQKQIKNMTIEQYSLLISSFIQYMPQQILVLTKEDNRILLMNEAAVKQLHTDAGYIGKITGAMSFYTVGADGSEVEISYCGEKGEEYLHIRAFALNWKDEEAVVYVISDISESKKELKALEIHAFRDNLTHLYNRTFGMKALEELLDKKSKFVLLFSDLDRLKFINDEFGHNEGDMYIINAAKHLLAFGTDAVVCRLGGDEYMALVPDITYEEAEVKAIEIYNALANDDYLSDKSYEYSMSFGFVAVDEGNTLSASELLNIADERMYENKRERKRARGLL